MRGHVGRQMSDMRRTVEKRAIWFHVLWFFVPVGSRFVFVLVFFTAFPGVPVQVGLCGPSGATDRRVPASCVMRGARRSWET